jgi:hypothetical protein
LLHQTVAQNHPAVTSGISRPERQQHQACVGGLAALQQAAQRVRADQRVVGVEDRHLAVAEQVRGGECGMRGAQSFLLHHGGVRGGFALHRCHVGADHDDDAVEHLLATCQQMAQHGAAGDPVQRLRQGGLHACAQAGGEDDGGCLHGLFPATFRCDLRTGRSGGQLSVSKIANMLLLQFAFRSATT